MTLNDYIKKTGQTQTQLAGQLDCKASTLSNILSGRKRPSLVFAVKIEQVTKGKVAPRTFITGDSCAN